MSLPFHQMIFRVIILKSPFSDHTIKAKRKKAGKLSSRKHYSGFTVRFQFPVPLQGMKPTEALD